jgi:hypothetical protein
MLIRTTVVAALAATLAACSSGSDEPQPSPACVRLTGISDQLTTAQSKLFEGGPGSRAALTRVVARLQSAQIGAPAKIRESLTALIGAFQEAELALREHTEKSANQLKDAASVLSVEGQKVTDYALAECSPGGPSPS